MRTSLCVWLMMLPALVYGGQVTKKSCQPWTKQQIDNGINNVKAIKL